MCVWLFAGRSSLLSGMDWAAAATQSRPTVQQQPPAATKADHRCSKQSAPPSTAGAPAAAGPGSSSNGAAAAASPSLAMNQAAEGGAAAGTATPLSDCATERVQQLKGEFEAAISALTPADLQDNSLFLRHPEMRRLLAMVVDDLIKAKPAPNSVVFELHGLLVRVIEIDLCWVCDLTI